MNIITAVDKNWAIGRDNELLVKLKEDMRFFKNMTYGKCVIMGRKTFESMGSKPLPGRFNIILSSTPMEEQKDMKVFSDIQSILDYVDIFFKSIDVFVIGGESIYRQFLPFCNLCYITKIDERFEADTFFPEDMDNYINDWRLTFSSSEHIQEFTPEEYMKLKILPKPVSLRIKEPKTGIAFKFCTYQRIQ